MIFEVLWTVDAVLRLLESYYCILRWIKWIGGGGGIFTKKKKFEWGTPTLENPEIAGKTWKSGFSQKILIHAVCILIHSLPFWTWLNEVNVGLEMFKMKMVQIWQN
jgi:hypothetical protein